MLIAMIVAIPHEVVSKFLKLLPQQHHLLVSLGELLTQIWYYLFRKVPTVFLNHIKGCVCSSKLLVEFVYLPPIYNRSDCF